MGILERDLSQAALDLLRKDYEVFTEVPLYNRCIDAVLIKNDRVITIEFKIKDWRRAVRQIRTHLLAADYSYLCMPERQAHNEMIDTLSRMGIGLWFFSNEKKKIIEHLKPKQSFVQQPMIKEKLLHYLLEEVRGSEYTQAFH